MYDRGMHYALTASRMAAGEPTTKVKALDNRRQQRRRSETIKTSEQKTIKDGGAPETLAPLLHGDKYFLEDV